MASDKKNTLFTSLSELIEIRKESLVELTQDLIKIPTLNPPGENYLEICEYLNKRLSKIGFETQIIRAKGTSGDSDKYPRWNIIEEKRVKTQENVSTSILILTLLKLGWVGHLIRLADRFLKEKSTVVEPVT